MKNIAITSHFNSVRVTPSLLASRVRVIGAGVCLVGKRLGSVEAHTGYGVGEGGAYNLRLGESSGGNTIGLRFLARHLVTFNFPKRMMYLKRTSVGPLADGQNISLFRNAEIAVLAPEKNSPPLRAK